MMLAAFDLISETLICCCFYLIEKMPPDSFEVGYIEARTGKWSRNYFTVYLAVPFSITPERCCYIPIGMAALWGNGGQAAGGQFPLEQWFYEMPPVTRWWTAATVVISLLVQCGVLSPLQLFYSFRAVYFKSQVCNLFFFFPFKWCNKLMKVTSTGGS